jgi:hypothetical protein
LPADGNDLSVYDGFLRERETVHETSFSFLYLANVLGAMCGTLLTADVFVELFGFRRTLGIAGVTNGVIAATSLALGRWFTVYRRCPAGISLRGRLHRRTAEKRSGSSGEAVGSPAPDLCDSVFNGFTSMSLEVIWVRDSRRRWGRQCTPLR